MKHRHASRILLGTAWYPEQDPEGEWDSDAALMHDLGFDVVRIGEFAWSRMQRADSTLTLDWIERAVETLARRTIRTILCTPTACPPVWLVERYPDLSPLHPDGTKGLFGGRRHASLFHPAYRESALTITEALARRFGRHPHVVGWQLDNEVGSYSAVDCSPPALQAFHRWLKEQFGTVEALNREWGLSFWNQEVEQFEQIPAPTLMQCTRSPQHILAYNRFCHEGMARFLLDQAQIVRAHVRPSTFVAASATWPVLERLFALQREQQTQCVDSVSVHQYPELMPDAGHPALHLALMRSLAPQLPLRVLEHQVGSSLSTSGGLHPAWRRLWSLECIANGARTLLWFHWRRFRTGCEWRHAPILERDRKPREVYRDLQRLIREIRCLSSELNGATLQAKSQILVSPLNMLGRDRSSEASFWMEIQLPDASHTRLPMWIRETLHAVFNPLHRVGLAPRFVHEDEEWNPEIPLIAPDLDILEPPLVKKLQRFCKAGGSFLCFPGAGERNRNGAQRNTPPPGLLSDLFGVQLARYIPLESYTGAVFDHTRGTVHQRPEPVPPFLDILVRTERIRFDARHGEVLAPCNNTVRILGVYAQGRYKSRPALSERSIGKGRAIYLGAVPADEIQAARLYRQLFPNARPLDLPVRQYRWTSSDKKCLVILINERPDPFPLPCPVRDRLTGRITAAVPPRGVTAYCETAPPI